MNELQESVKQIAAWSNDQIESAMRTFHLLGYSYLTNDEREIVDFVIN